MTTRPPAGGGARQWLVRGGLVAGAVAVGSGLVVSARLARQAARRRRQLLAEAASRAEDQPPGGG